MHFDSWLQFLGDLEPCLSQNPGVGSRARRGDVSTLSHQAL